MDYLQDNIEVLKSAQPELADKVLAYEAAEVPVYIQEATRQEGLNTLKVKRDDGNFLYLHSRFDPRKEAQNFIDHIDCTDKFSFIIFGLGLGYHLRALAKKIKKTPVVLVIEKDLEAFVLFLKQVDLKEFAGKKVIFIVDLPIDEVLKTVQGIMWNIAVAKNVFIPYQPITTINFDPIREYYEKLAKDLQQEVMSYNININTIRHRTYDVFRNTFNNFDHIVDSPGINRLFGKTPGKPAIVVAAGPSLNKQLPLLRSLKDKAVIFCVDTALRTLLAEGIKPDIVGAVDYLQLNYDKVKGVDREGYYLAALPTVVPDFYDDFRDQLFVLYNIQPFYRFLEDKLEPKGALPSGGSVAHTCFQLALEMGCDPVIFIGLDLAFTGGVSHSANSIYADVKYTDQELKEMVAVEGVDGDIVYTSGDMASFILAFNRMIEICDAQVIDATEGGARIRGAELMTFRDAAAKYCGSALHVREILDKCHTAPVKTTRADAEGLLQEMLDDMERLKETCTEGSTVSKRLQKYYRRKNYNVQKAQGYMAEIRKSYDQVLKIPPGLQSMVDTLLMHFSVVFSQNQKIWEEGDEVNRKQLSKDLGVVGDFFENILEACRIYKDMIMEAQETVRQDGGASA